MEKLPTILAKIDLKSTGTLQRWTIGKVGDVVSGAIYLSKDIKLPVELTIGFLAGSSQHEKNKEEDKE